MPLDRAVICMKTANLLVTAILAYLLHISCLKKFYFDLFEVQVELNLTVY